MFCCCFYISCSVTALQSLPNIVRLTQLCAYVCIRLLVCVRDGGRGPGQEAIFQELLLYLLPPCVFLATASDLYNEITYICARPGVRPQLAGGADGGRALLLQRGPDESIGGGGVDCMMQNHTDSLTYT